MCSLFLNSLFQFFYLLIRVDSVFVFTDGNNLKKLNLIIVLWILCNMYHLKRAQTEIWVTTLSKCPCPRGLQSCRAVTCALGPSSCPVLETVFSIPIFFLVFQLFDFPHTFPLLLLNYWHREPLKPSLLNLCPELKLIIYDWGPVLRFMWSKFA